MSQFLALGDVLINRALLAYAVVDADTEGPRVRLGFLGAAHEGPAELMLAGFEARSALRWLREHAEFRDAGGPSFRHGRSSREARRVVRQVRQNGAGTTVASADLPCSLLESVAQTGR